MPLIEEIKPDILITDIKMPFVNGLELSKIVKKNMPLIKIVILSGHDEFEYTKEAISINVNEYLLKPITSKDLINALNKVVEQIEDEKRQKENYHLIQQPPQRQHADDEGKVLKRSGYRCIALYRGNRKSRQFRPDIIARFYAAVLIKLEYNRDRSSYEDYSEYLKAEEIINDIVDKNDDVLKYKVNLKSMVLIVKNDNAEELESYCFLLAQSIKSEVERNTCCTIAASIGSIRERIQGIASSLKDAEIAMSFSYIFGKDEIIGIQDTKFSKMISKDLFSLDEATIIDYLRFKDEKVYTCKSLLL